MCSWSFRVHRIVGVLLLAGAFTGLVVSRSLSLSPADVVPIGMFSEMDPTRDRPEEWQALPLAEVYKKTVYDLVEKDGTVVLRARSDSSTSAIGVERRVDLMSRPILEWRWKVGGLIAGSDVRQRARFDAPARVVVDFEYDDLRLLYRLKTVAMRALGYDIVPKRSIMYVWSNRMPLETVASTPYAEWIKMVPVQRGSTKVGTWVTERRDVRADYRRIFGEEPPPVHGVALMTDTNSLGDSVTTYYGDIVFRRARPDSAAGGLPSFGQFIRPKKQS